METLDIKTPNAPAAIGTYSQAISVRANQSVYLSGQIPLDPVSMEVVSPVFLDQAHQVFKNLEAVATAAGGSLANCVKLNIYLTDLGQFATLNEVMAEYFDPPYPARAAVEVSALPKGVDIEIDGVMALE
jgi:reactive intermediate/imine deaminase